MQTSSFKAVVITGPGRAEVREFPARPLQPHEIRVANTFSAVSLGTEYLIVSGQLPGSAFPCLLGYQGVGKIVEVGPEVAGYQIGERVCSGTSTCHPNGFGQGAGNAHMSHPVVLDKGDSFQTVLARVPAEVSDEEAAYAWLGAVSLQGIDRARVISGDVVLVVGLGIVGQLAAQLCRARGATVYACDLAAERVRLAERYSADVAVVGGPAAIQKQLVAKHPQGATVVIECSGNGKAFDASLGLVGTGGRVVLQGYHTGSLTFQFHQAHMKRLTFFFPCGWMDLRPVLELIRQRKVQLSPWIGQVFEVGGVPELYARVHQRDATLTGALIRW